MLKITRLAGLAVLSLVTATVPSTVKAQGVVILGPPPMRTVYSAPVQTVVSQSVVTRTPIGPAAYVSPAPYAVYAPARRVVTTTTVVPTTSYVATTAYVPQTTYVPTTTYLPAVSRSVVVGPALAPVGYEIIKPNGRVKVVYPRRVYRYGY